MKFSSVLFVALVVALGPRAARAADSGPATLDLPAALAELEQKNPGLGVAHAQTRAAGARIREARAAMLPTLVATGGYVRNSAEVQVRLGALLSQVPGAPNVGNIVIQPLDAWTASGTLNVPLLEPSAWYEVDAAKAGEKAAKASSEVARLELRTQFATLAYGAEALRAVVSASERAVDLAREQVKSAERRVASGTAAPLDVLRAKADQVNRESDLTRARADVERAELALGILLGRERPVVITVPELVSEQSKARTETTTRPRAELTALDAKAEAARARIRSARARHLPTLHAMGSLFASDEPYPTGDRTGWRVGVELKIPLYDGGFRYGKRREAEAELDAAQAELSERRLKIRQEVSDARREVKVARERKRLAFAQQELASSAAQSAKRSYDAGVSTTLDVLDANDKLYKADVALAQADAQLAQSLIGLQRALGTGP